MKRVVVAAILGVIGMATLAAAVGAASEGQTEWAGSEVALPSPSGPGQSHRAEGGVIRPERLREPGASAQAVIGGDDRIRISPTTQIPFRAIVELQMVDAFGNEVGCTGTFVGPDVILTAAHCLWDRETETWTFAIFVVPAIDGGTMPYGYAEATDWWVPDAYIDDGADEFDWGVIKLPNFALTDMTGWMRIGVLDWETLVEEDFWPAVAGYPGDKPESTMWGSSATSFDEVDDLNLYHSVDSFSGESGSAVWSLNDEKFYFGFVVGVHSRGSSQGNVAARIGLLQMADILEGCRQMGCTVDYRVQVPGSTPTPTRSSTATPTRTNTPTRTPTPVANPPGNGQPLRPFRAVIPLVSADD